MRQQVFCLQQISPERRNLLRTLIMTEGHDQSEKGSKSDHRAAPRPDLALLLGKKYTEAEPKDF